MIQFLNTKSGIELVEIFGDGFCPVVDNHFLLDDPWTLYSSGQFHPVDLMAGFTSHEGAFFLFNLFLGVDSNTEFESVDMAKVAVDLMIKKVQFRRHPRADEISKAVWQEYFLEGQLDSRLLIQTLVELFGDLVFVAPCIQTADWHAGHYFNTHLLLASFVHILL